MTSLRVQVAWLTTCNILWSSSRHFQKHKVYCFPTWWQTIYGSQIKVTTNVGSFSKEGTDKRGTSPLDASDAREVWILIITVQLSGRTSWSSIHSGVFRRRSPITIAVATTNQRGKRSNMLNHGRALNTMTLVFALVHESGILVLALEIEIACHGTRLWLLRRLVSAPMFWHWCMS